MQTKNEVEKIISYLEAKLQSIKEKMERYEGPIMGEVLKNNPQVSSEYFRLCALADEIEDNLLAIRKFSANEKKNTKG
jgi:hypothetical protein